MSLRDYVYVAPPPQSQSVTCRPFSGLVVVMTHTTLQDSGVDRSAYCGGVWKAQAALGYSPIVLGDATHLREALGTPPAPYTHAVKLATHAAFLSDVVRDGALPGGTLVVYLDAVDVLAFGGPHDVLDCVSATFCNRTLDPSADVLFLGEKSIWPPSSQCTYADEARSWCQAHRGGAGAVPVVPDLTEPGGNPEFKRLNTGLLAGSVAALHALVTAAHRRAAAAGVTIDQEALNDMVTNAPEWRRRVHLDTRQVCFGSGHLTERDYRVRAEDGRCVNVKTGTAPLLLHFHGGGKRWIHNVTRRAAGHGESWGASRQLDGARLLLWGNGTATSRPVRTHELCAGYDVYRDPLLEERPWRKRQAPPGGGRYGRPTAGGGS